MPGVLEAITFLIVAAQAGALGAGISAVIGAFGGSLLGLGLSVGISFLSSLIFRPQQPKPEDVQSSVKNPTAVRQRHYGRVKTSGPWAFGESKEGHFHKVIAIGTGQIDAIEEYWIDDNLVTIGGGDLVVTAPYTSRARIQTRLGLPTETAYSNLTAVFPEWDSDHRGDGVASLYATQFAIAPDVMNSVFPKLTATDYRVVIRGALIYNPLTEATAWTDNAAAVIRDYMIHADGMRLPAALVNTTQAAAGWLAAAQRAAELVPLKAGGTEARYRLWGSYYLNERPADVLGRMLNSCDGVIVPTPDGGITLDIGTWVVPTVIIDADMIVGFDVRRGRDILTTANVISATFLSPDHDYQATDADQWVDEDDVALRGEIVSDTSFAMAPSHGQARRLMKLAAYRSNPNWVCTLQCNLRALAAFGKRFVRVRYPLFGIDEVFELKSFLFNFGEGGILASVTLDIHSMPSDAYAWDAEAEEGTAPISEVTVVSDTIPVPTGFAGTVFTTTTGSGTVSFVELVWSASPTGLRVEAQGREVGAVDWIPIPVADGSASTISWPLDDVTEYEFRIRHVSLTGRTSDWTDTLTLPVLAMLNFSINSNSQYVPVIF